MAKAKDVNTEIAQEVIVGMDKSYENILLLNTDGNLLLKWIEGDFKELPDEVVMKLRPDNMRRYLQIETAVKQKAKVAGKLSVKNPFNPLMSREDAVLAIRPRKGWHQAWKSPGREFDLAMVGPYKQVRKPGTDSNGKDKVEEAGYETGEVKKLIDGDGKVELIAVECPQELFDQYLEYMAASSKQKYTDVKTSFFEKTEELNRSAGKGSRITPIDESNELQA